MVETRRENLQPFLRFSRAPVLGPSQLGGENTKADTMRENLPQFVTQYKQSYYQRLTWNIIRSRRGIEGSQPSYEEAYGQQWTFKSC